MPPSAEDETVRMAEQKFPVKLHAMLMSLEAEGGSSIASWMPHGCCFKVHNQERFMSEVLPKWFKLTKHTSFIRQLNIYNFKRISSGVDAGSYYHPHFVRSWPRMAEKIDRVKAKSSGDPIFSPEPMGQEPNFYMYAPLPPAAVEPPLNMATQTALQQHQLANESAVQHCLREQQKRFLVHQPRGEHPSIALPLRADFRTVARSQGAGIDLAQSVLGLDSVLNGNTNLLSLPPLYPSQLSVESAMLALQARRLNLGSRSAETLQGPIMVAPRASLHIDDHLRAMLSRTPLPSLSVSPFGEPDASSLQYVPTLGVDPARRLGVGVRFPQEITPNALTFSAGRRSYENRAAAASSLLVPDASDALMRTLNASGRQHDHFAS